MDCFICKYEFYEDDSLRCLENCNHKFHNDCIKSWFEHCVEKKIDIVCPYRCQPKIEDIKQILSAECYENYLCYNKENLVKTYKNFIICSTPDCEEILDTAEISLKCKVCNKETCKDCK